MAVGALLAVFGVPWWLGMLALRRIVSIRATSGAWSLILNSAALVVTCLVLRSTVGVQRGSFLAAWLAWTGLWVLLAGGPTRLIADARAVWQQTNVGLLIGIATMIVGIALFGREQFVQCFNGDGTQACELAASLEYHFLPYFEIEETNTFGTTISNPLVVTSYWSFALQLLLGKGEFSTRLPYWVWWLAIFLASFRMAQPKGARQSWRPAIPLALAGFLSVIWYTFYTGYYPYMTDLASPGALDGLYVLAIVLAMDCLRRADCAGCVALTTLAALVFYPGAAVLLLVAVAALVFKPVERRRMVVSTLVGFGVLLGIAAFYVARIWAEGVLPGLWPTIQVEYVADYYQPGERPDSALLYAGYFLLGCGGIPVLGLFRPFWRNAAGGRDAGSIAWERTVAGLTLMYLLIVLGSNCKNLHYLGPLLPMTLILWLRTAGEATRPRIAVRITSLATAASLLACIYICWPVSRPVFTLNRQLGAETTFQTDSYQQACIWGRITADLYNRGDLGWQIGRHTWASYSELNARPAEPRTLLITKATAPSPDYKLVFKSADGVKLYCRNLDRLRWFARQRPSIGPDRFPRLFRPIAIPSRPRGG